MNLPCLFATNPCVTAAVNVVADEDPVVVDIPGVRIDGTRYHQRRKRVALHTVRISMLGGGGGRAGHGLARIDADEEPNADQHCVEFHAVHDCPPQRLKTGTKEPT